MKNLNLLFLITLLSGVMFFSSCETEDDIIDNPVDISNLTITEYASDNSDFSILVEALSKTGLDEVLNMSGNYTVFAPDNDAFNTLFEGLGVNGLDDLDAQSLTPILLYHVLNTKISSDMISDGYYSSISPSQGRNLSMKISTGNGVMINEKSMVSNADIMLSNGIIHGVDQVIMPPSIVDLAMQNGSFNSLVSAVTEAGLAGTLSDANASFTVFAPTDAAFAELTEVPSDLTPVLLYHVLNGAIFSDMVSSSIVKSLNPTDPEIIFEVSDAGVMLNGMANVVATDIVGTNGVIHVIDKVITPIANSSILDIALGIEDFSSLVNALSLTNLASTFIKEGDYTVFAPTNKAFNAFLEENGLSFSDLSPEDLMPILMYHVIGSKAVSTNLETGYYNSIYEAMEGNPVSILVEVNDGVKINSKINVTTADVMASNGVIHVIDGIMTPTSVVDIAINNAGFTNLVEAVVKAGLVETLNGEGPFTIFAPTDEAFSQVLSDMGLNSVNDLDAETLIPILQYHVVSGNVKSTDLSSGEIATLNGNILINLDNMATINGDSQIIATDIQGTNGVVHVINKVLIP